MIKYYLTHTKQDKGIHTFLKGISPKVNVILSAQLAGTVEDTDCISAER